MPIFTPRNRYIAILALVAGLILIVGWQLRPRIASEVPMSQADLSRLSRMTKKGELEASAAFFAEVASRVQVSTLWVDRLEQPAIVWDRTGTVIAPAAPVYATTEAYIRGVDDAEIPLVTELYSHSLLFRLLKAPPELSLEPVRMAGDNDLATGSWLVAVKRSGVGATEMGAGVLSGVRDFRCGEMEVRELLTSFTLTPASLGIAIFDLEGRFRGIVLDCEGTPRIISGETVSRAIERARAVDSQILFRYGFRPAEMNAPLQQYFGVKAGLLVREVWKESVAWKAGIRPGDIIADLDNEPVARLDDLAMMTVPMYRPTYPITLRRGRVSRKLELLPGAGLGGETENAVPPALLVDSPSRDIVIRAVQPNTPEARAGLRAGDVLVSTGPQFGVGRLSPASLNENRDKGLFVVVERHGVLRGLFLEAEEATPNE